MFQTTVRKELGFGIVGEQYLDGPMRAQPAITGSPSGTQNVIGRACTVVTDATASYETAVDPRPLEIRVGGDGLFAGILAHPKAYVLVGSPGVGNLGPSLILPNGVMCELVQEAAGMIVAINTADGWKTGDFVYYSTTTGEFTTAAPDAETPAGYTRLPGGRVTRYASAAPGLGVITFNDNVDPVPAAAAAAQSAALDGDDE